MKLKYTDNVKSEYKFENGNITFYDTELNITQLIKIERYILNTGNYDTIIFDDIKIIDFGSNLILLEIENDEIQKYKIGYINNFEAKGMYAKELGNNRHFPRYKGNFEYNGKTYLMIDGLNKLTEEIDIEKGVYKGIIVNPEKYLQVDKSVEKVSGEIEGILFKIKKLIIK